MEKKDGELVFGQDVIPPFYIRSLASRFEEARARLEEHLGHADFSFSEYRGYVPLDLIEEMNVAAATDLLAATARARYREVQGQIALRLVDIERFSVRDAAEMMDLSSTRVQQLLNTARSGKEPGVETEGLTWANYESFADQLVERMESAVRAGEGDDDAAKFLAEANSE